MLVILSCDIMYKYIYDIRMYKYIYTHVKNPIKTGGGVSRVGVLIVSSSIHILL